ncbi:MAG: hypothetical protein ACRCVL_05710, partial [Cetobacterium sp.]
MEWFEQEGKRRREEKLKTPQSKEQEKEKATAPPSGEWVEQLQPPPYNEQKKPDFHGIYPVINTGEKGEAQEIELEITGGQVKVVIRQMSVEKGDMKHKYEGPYHPSSEEGSQREENEILRHKDEQKGGSEHPRGTTKEEGKENQQEMDEVGGYQLHWDDQIEDINTQWGKEHPHLSHQQTEAINTEWLARHPQLQYIRAHSTPTSKEYRMRLDKAYWVSRRRMQDLQLEEQSALMDKMHESLKKLESRTNMALRASQGGQGEHHREKEEKGGAETVDERMKRSAGQQSQTSLATEDEEEISQGMGPEEKSQPGNRSMKVRIDGEVQLTSLEQVNLWPDKEQGEAIKAVLKQSCMA